MNYVERKKLHVELAEKHLAADMLIKGTYGETDGSFKGCSIGCLSHDIDPEREDYHAHLEEYLGPLEWWWRLQDTIFEGLPDGQNRYWHKQAADALALLPEDYDWQKAYHRTQIAILRIAYQHAGTSKEVVQKVIDLHELSANGGTVSTDDWAAAGAAARAAEEAAEAARAARTAAEAAGAAAAEAEWEEARTAAGEAAGEAAWTAWEAAREARQAAWATAWATAWEEIRDGVLAAISPDFK